jgi:excisionase family DNA binding protein
MTMLTVTQVAERLSCSAALVYQLCADGRIAHHRLGLGRGTIRITEDGLSEYLLKTHNTTTQPAKTLVGLKHIRLPLRYSAPT